MSDVACASPALPVSARRLAALHRLQAGKQGSQLLVTTVNAMLQRVLTPYGRALSGLPTEEDDDDR